jgi:hypothetical protein
MSNGAGDGTILALTQADFETVSATLFHANEDCSIAPV